MANKNYDISIMSEIKEKDKLDKISFFDINNQTFENKSKDIFKNKKIYLLFYPHN